MQYVCLCSYLDRIVEIRRRMKVGVYSAVHMLFYRDFDYLLWTDALSDENN